MKRVVNILKEREAYAGTFYEIGEHSPIAGIKNGIQLFRASGADVIVSVGGGSPIDATKAMIYNIQKESGGAFYGQIAIPTTLSAAEYTVSYLISSCDLNMTYVFSDRCGLYKRTRTESCCRCSGVGPVWRYTRCRANHCNSGTSLVSIYWILSGQFPYFAPSGYPLASALLTMPLVRGFYLSY